MSFNANLSEDELARILKKGITSDLEKVISEEIYKSALTDFESKVKPMIKTKVTEVVRQLQKVTTGITQNVSTGQTIINVMIQ